MGESFSWSSGQGGMSALITQDVVPFFGPTDGHRPRILHEYPNRMPFIRAHLHRSAHRATSARRGTRCSAGVRDPIHGRVAPSKNLFHQSVERGEGKEYYVGRKDSSPI